MRTFHTGGVFSGDIMHEIRSPYNGIIEFPEILQGTLIRTPHGKIAFLTKNMGELIIRENCDNFSVPLKKEETTSSTSKNNFKILSIKNREKSRLSEKKFFFELKYQLQQFYLFDMEKKF